jgi:transposase
VLPRTRREDKQFRKRVTESSDSIHWEDLYEVVDDEGEVVDRFRVAAEPFRTSDGFRLVWLFSQRKKDQDELTRVRQIEQIRQELNKLRERLQSPKTRFRTRPKVQEAVEKILSESHAGRTVDVQIKEEQRESFTQASPGRPGPETQYIKKVVTRYDLTIDLDLGQLADAMATDGIFPLMTNADEMSAEEILRAYKRQPLVEKRFSQFKNDFVVAPVYLKEVSRIQALLCVYFFVLVAQTLLERELRQAMEREKIDDLPLYPEGRPCVAPTTHRVIDLFEPIQRHELTRGRSTETFVTKLSRVHRKVIKLLHLKAERYGK